MRYLFCLLAALGMLTACSSNNDQADTELKDPAVTHPPSEAIPDSAQVVNDSVIVPDATPIDSAAGRGDSLPGNR